jgi:hypothetical protein
MKKEIIKVRASLTLATKDDLFSHGDIPRENKKLFLKNPVDSSWAGVYPIAGTCRYTIIELVKGMAMQQFYKINHTHHPYDIEIKLYLEKATEFDLFYTPKYLKHNTIYYVLKDGDTVTGPHYVMEGDPNHKYREAIEKGSLWVISNRQTFEPYQIKKSA